MPIKLTGAQLKAFLNDTEFWPEGRWMDDDVVERNGEVEEDFDWLSAADTDSIKLIDGVVFEDNGDEVGGLVPLARRWLKAQTSTCFLVTVDKTKEEEIKALIRKAGGKVS